MRQYRLVAALCAASALAAIASPAAAQFRSAARGLAAALEADFSTLDRNDDGGITRNEWIAAFERQDLNGDGAITRRELGGRVQAGPVLDPDAQPRVRTFDVDPRVPWVFSGFTVNKGDTLVVTVQGSVQLSEDAGDTATAAGSQSGRRAAGAPMPRELAGALIARIGNTAPFGVGDQIQIIAPASGELFLGVNDDFLGDNRGRFRVRIALR
jgi:hypothetical protein